MIYWNLYSYMPITNQMSQVDTVLSQEQHFDQENKQVQLCLFLLHRFRRKMIQDEYIPWLVLGCRNQTTGADNNRKTSFIYPVIDFWQCKVNVNYKKMLPSVSRQEPFQVQHHRWLAYIVCVYVQC